MGAMDKDHGYDTVGDTCQRYPRDAGEETEALFAYGLLQPGEPLYGEIAEYVAGYLRGAYVRGYVMYASSFPMAVPGDMDRRIWGTVLFITRPREIMPVIDVIEAGYDRVTVKACLSNGKIAAWMYVYRGKPNGTFVESGDFIAWRDNRRHGYD